MEALKVVIVNLINLAILVPALIQVHVIASVVIRLNLLSNIGHAKFLQDGIGDDVKQQPIIRIIFDLSGLKQIISNLLLFSSRVLIPDVGVGKV